MNGGGKNPGPGALALWKARDVRGLITRYSDVGLAALVIAIVGMMIIPLPTFLLDLLIALNISIAVILLLISIYINEALKIATFPTVLLIATLFRLAIEVSATRLILLKADAGEVIHAFGNFVVSGNLVVGAVIFLILTMIQFIVIAKGSERVAEVGARFTLDAMPGKQMSIDAELRAGHIDHLEARRRRGALAREAQFFGSMDGAMKFVKGDAIAGIIILCINIVGGLIIGVMQRGMEIGAAARTYTILTIGEGLVSQIPALIISTAAGVIVTRVASDDEEGHLGKDIGTQILAQPKALAIGAGLMFLFAIVPGMPAVPFLALGTGFALVARALLKKPKVVAMEDAGDAVPGTGGASAKRKTAVTGDARELPAPVLNPISIDLSPGLAARLMAPAPTDRTPVAGSGSAADRLTSELIPAARERLFFETGLPLPSVRLRRNVPGLPDGGFVIRLQEVPMGQAVIPEGHLLALVSPERIGELGLDVEIDPRAAARHPDGSPALWVDAGLRAQFGPAGIATLAPEEIIIAHLFEVVRRHGHELLGIQETQTLLEGLERTHPALVREVVPKLVSPVLLADVCKRLAEEGISLRALREIIEALAEWAPVVRDPVELTERVRGALRRQISHKYSTGGTLPVFLLDPMIEDTVREAITKTDHGSYLALAPELSRDIIVAAQKAVGTPASGLGGQGLPVVLTSAEIRRYLRRLLETELPHLPVLSFQELSPETKIQPVGRISVGA